MSANRRRLDSRPQRILSAGLAAATAVGVVGVLAVRSAQDSAAAEQGDATPAAAEPTTSDGLTQADLDAYAAALDAERQRLKDYRARLVAVAESLGGRVPGAGATQAAVTSRKPSPAPKPKAAPRVKPRPQAQSQGS